VHPRRPLNVTGSSRSKSGWPFIVEARMARTIGSDAAASGGDSGLRQRNMTHGVVLLNRTDTLRTVALSQGNCLIAGTRDTTVNDGAPAEVVTGASPAVALLVRR
jgi:hypothetical protein